MRKYNLLRLGLVVGLFLLTSGVEGSSGSPFVRPHHWGSTLPPLGRTSAPDMHSSRSPLNPRAQRYLAKLGKEEKEEDDDNNDGKLMEPYPRIPRGGQDADAFVKVVGTVTQIIVQTGKVVLPPVVALTKLVVGVYGALPKDAIVAQVGLVYAFAGGYYPTLFSSLQAAQQFGWNVMVQAISELTEEAVRVIEALDDVKTSKFGFDDELDVSKKRARMKRSFLQKTNVVLATVDPVKINTAAGALYTTWLGVSTVLEREYARVITLSLTMAEYIERVASFIFAPPAYFFVAEDYHQWVPVVIGWGCKALAMNIAWRLQRLMTAATSAVTGGLLFARSLSRMLSKRGIRLFGLIREDDEKTFLDELIGLIIAGLGFYTQFECQWRSGFSFNVPFPLNLVTWPFDFAERWIQWQITKKK